MDTKAQWKLVIGILIILLMVSVLERLHISIELVLLSLLFIGLIYVILLPQWLITFLRRLIHVSKKEEAKRGVWDTAWRVGVLMIVKTIHEAFWGKKHKT